MLWVIGAIAVVAAAVFAGWRVFADIFTGTSIVRVPSVTFNGFYVDDPDCAGNYRGAGTIVANYPPIGPKMGNAVPANVTVKIVDVTNTQTALDPLAQPVTVTAQNDSFGFTFSGHLIDPCKTGTVRADVSYTPVGVASPQTAGVQGPPYDVPAVGFTIVTPIDASGTADTFTATFTLKCCPHGASGVSISWDKNPLNVSTITCTPSAALDCSIDTQKTFTISGKRDGPVAFSVYLTTTDLNPRRCRLGLVEVS